jgi:hypothetical protein
MYIKLDIIRENPDNAEKEERFFQFCKNYGDVFARPYMNDEFDFGDKKFREELNSYAKQMPIMNEPRGDKNFIYSTKVHIGLYSILMKLGAVINTRKSKKITHEVLEIMKNEVR